jgi:N-acetylmuramoyl-L-alanine amidase
MTALLCGAFAVSASAANETTNVGAGIVRVNELCLRTATNSQSTILDYASKGDNVAIIKWANSEWYEVIYNGKRGFMKAEFVAPTDSLNYEVGIGEIVGDSVRLRETPGTDGTVLKILKLDSTVKVTGVNTEWYKVESGEVKGYIRSDYIRIVFVDSKTNTGGGLLIDQDTGTGTTPAPLTVKNDSYTNSTGELIFDSSSTTGKLSEFAMKFLGTRYVYGGASPDSGFDCSGFVMYVCGQYGVKLPHGATAQSKYGTAVAADELKTGDLVFFGPGGGINHSGIYLGDGVFIHASSAGACVKLNNLSDSYYKTNYRGAVRVF